MQLRCLNEILSFRFLGEDFQKLKQDINEKNVLCLAANKGERIHLTAALEKPIVYVARDSYTALLAFQKLKAYIGDEICLFQPNDDLLLYRKVFQKSYAGERVRALYKFATGECKILVTSSIALIQFVPQINRLLSTVYTLKVGTHVDIIELTEKFSALGYEREEVCEEKNTFAVHGDILDIFLPYIDTPIRISFFDDLVENIRTYDLESLLSTGSMDEITFYPNNDLLYTLDEIELAVSKATAESKKLSVNAASRCDQILGDLITQSTCTQQMQWLIPYLRNSNSTIFDYMNNNSILVFDEPEAISNLIANYTKETLARVKELMLDGEVTKSHILSILSDAELHEGINKNRALVFSNLKSTNTLVKIQEILEIQSKHLNNYIFHYDVLHDDLINFNRNGFMTIICQPTKDRAKTLQQSLIQEDVPCSYREELSEFQVGTFIISEDIQEGFVYPKSKVAIIGYSDISKNGNDSYKKKNNKTIFVMPQVGDYVVHEIHGIGKCLGPQRIKTGSVEQDYILVEYQKGALLYVPTSQMDRLSRYSGSEITPRLSELGGKDFGRIKAKVKNSLKQIAIDLVSLYSKRMNKQGIRYSEDDELMEEFENSFEFEPTPDQIDAIKDIKQDMERGIIMDRLLCGDVGYGKTEVAFRAIFKTILNGKQAAILAPTTILAQQHYLTAIERFKPFGVNIELISRLKSDKEIKDSLENLKDGKSQVVVATHRLLSQDVQFKDLGLLVLDEEQRFGVEHKEKLKVLNNKLNVLTLSATPIPRTLNMSLIGVRDISVLETPPVNRIPIQTSVAELTPALLEDTIRRELARGGQVFILHNEVSSIQRFTNDVKELVPEANIVFAHGQMASEELEARVNKFYAKEADVLVCTTIIENGIDIPNANTLIVCDADRLGLSQLYQLRGRVGRSNRLAYAYFTINPSKVLTDTALKRLNAIMDYTELGSGFKIAMRDLEIRGAGNILGKEQHGHIEKVGYDMYCKLLQECVNEIQGIQNNNTVCQVDAEINAYLDHNYVQDDNSRLKVFRDILDSHSMEDVNHLQIRLHDSFGELPQSLINLITIGLVKNLGQELNIEHIKINAQELTLTFAQIDFFQNEKLMTAISELKDICAFTNEEKPKLKFNCKTMSNTSKLEFLKNFLLKATC